MDWDRAADATLRACDPLLERLQDVGLERVLDVCSRWGKERVLEYRYACKSDIGRLLLASPNRRDQLLDNLPEEERIIQLILACHHVRAGYALLTTVSSFALSDGPSPRKSKQYAQQAGRAAWSLLSAFPPLWPFDDGEDPFAEGLNEI